MSNLPLDITEQEFIDLMQKCGLIMKDVDNGQMKIKLYTERGTNILKGDALCTYIKVWLNLIKVPTVVWIEICLKCNTIVIF